MDNDIAEVDKLQKEARVGIVLEELRNHNGWAEFVNILTEIHDEAAKKLYLSEDIEARVTIKVITELAERFELNIKKGEVAKQELKQMFGTG